MGEKITTTQVSASQPAGAKVTTGISVTAVATHGTGVPAHSPNTVIQFYRDDATGRTYTWIGGTWYG